MSQAYKERKAIEQVERVNAALDAEYLVYLLTEPVIQKKELIINKFQTSDWTCEFQRGARVTATMNIRTGQFIRFDFHERKRFHI